MSCSAGFYVRVFAHALGELVGTGACLESLRRTRSGAVRPADAVTLEDLQRDPVGVRPAALFRWIGCCRIFPARRLTDEGRSRVSHGQDVDRAHLWPEDSACLETRPAAEWVRLLDGGGRLLALANARHAARSALHPAVVLF